MIIWWFHLKRPWGLIFHSSQFLPLSIHNISNTGVLFCHQMVNIRTKVRIHPLLQCIAGYILCWLKREKTPMTDTAHPSLPLSWDKYFQPLHPGVNSFPESPSRTFLFIFVNFAASSNLLQASANLWQYLDNYIQAPLSPPELAGWAPPGPLGLQGILRCLLPPYLAHGTHMSVALFPRL